MRAARSSASKRAPGSTRWRISTVLRKKPISRSVPGCTRAPTGEAITTSRWPVMRASQAATAACRNMNRVQ
ncbi:hypothetical protein A8H28_30655 [Burkholderia gladioli pv. gladioli]|nr:hypothetical protein A8H28_30655 [Burkholderia gladioli pv. gladioli]